MDELTPRQIVNELDRYIIGQYDAKKAVAIALRNRYRRSMLEPKLRDEITPKNIILVGSTGVGKTEISRRLAKLVSAPFIKVEASKYTEVGYVGRDVESMIRDLVEESIRMSKRQSMDEVRDRAKGHAEERILDILFPTRRKREQSTFMLFAPDEDEKSPGEDDEDRKNKTRERFRTLLRDGKLEDTIIEIEVEDSQSPIGFIPGLGSEDIMIQMQDVFDNLFPKQKRKKKVSVAEARRIFEQEEAQKLIDMDEVIDLAIENVEQRGIIFLDEIDKIAGESKGSGPDVSREGVQRDILPIVEGTTVMTKYGPVKTDHILFIAAGAFHVSKISDLIPELQGRFPIHVELKSLTQSDFKKILTQPENAIVKQQIALMKVEGVDIIFSDDAIDAIANAAYVMNQTKENIGARRLYTVLEQVMEDISFNADEMSGQQVNIDADYIKKALRDAIEETDLRKYIL